MKYLLTISFLLIFFQETVGQLTYEEQAQLDSLNEIINNKLSQDTALASANNALCEILYVHNFDTVSFFSNNTVKIVEEALQKENSKEAIRSLKKSLGSAYSNLGIIESYHGNTAGGLDKYLKAIDLFNEVGYKRGMASVTNNIGTLYEDLGDIPNALKYLNKSLAINEEINSLAGIANASNSIAYLYNNQGEHKLALDYYEKCLQINIDIDDKPSQALNLNNIGYTLDKLDENEKALATYLKCLSLYTELGEHNYYNGRSTCINNIGSIYLELKDFEEALYYYNESLIIEEEQDNKSGIVISLNNIAGILYRNNDLKKAKEYAARSFRISKELGYPSLLSKSAHLKSKIAQKKGNYEESLEMYQLYIKLKDSINNASTQKATIKRQAKYEYEKQATADSIVFAENKKVQDALLTAEKAENKHRKQQTYYLYGGLCLALLFGIFIFNRFRVTQKQKIIIEEQKEKVDEAFEELGEKNQEIMDSINYAKRIQSAILPPLSLVNQHLKDAFILYKPKDIVAGDFYWMEPKNGKVLFAAADCTGHGVPGAMVSVVCNNGLNRSVREYDLTDPGKILDKTRQIVIEEFEKSEEEVKDGMDIALCSLEGNVLKYAGAHNPLWIIREGEVLETKADKQPIGKFDKQTAYKTHTFELLKGDTFYLFSDGYVDQFGGEKGKKFKNKAFKSLLISIQNESMEKQFELIDKAFETWKGELEQLDDVCVIGVRV